MEKCKATIVFGYPQYEIRIAFLKATSTGNKITQFFPASWNQIRRHYHSNKILRFLLLHILEFLAEFLTMKFLENTFVQKQDYVITLFSPRPASSPQPARWRAFVLPSFGPPSIHELYFRHRVAPVFVSLRPSATVAAWQPGPAAPIRVKASVRLVYGSRAFARHHPRPGERRKSIVIRLATDCNNPKRMKKISTAAAVKDCSKQ